MSTPLLSNLFIERFSMTTEVLFTTNLQQTHLSPFLLALLCLFVFRLTVW